MAKDTEFVGRSVDGDLSQALQAAIAAAGRGMNANFFAWRLKEIGGSVGGFVGARDVTVTIGVAGDPQLAALAEKGGRTECEWHAWHDRMPGKRPTLHVAGSCVFPTAGYTVELRPAVPQGINPAIYIMEKIVTPPSGPAAQVVTVVPVHYREVTSARYTHVFIVPDNISIPVQEVS